MSEYTICTVRCLLGGHFDTVHYALLGAHTNALCTVHDMHYVGSKQYAHSMQYVQLCIGKGCPKLSTTLLHNLVSASRALSCTAGLAPSGLAFWPNIHKYKYKYKFKYWWLHHMHLVALQGLHQTPPSWPTFLIQYTQIQIQLKIKLQKIHIQTEILVSASHALSCTAGLAPTTTF